MDTDVVKIKDRRCQLKHIIAVWQMFSVERARQLTLNGQDSFETLSDIFREELNAFQKLQLQRSVRNLDLDNLLHQYYEYIAYELKRKGAIGGTMGDLEDAEIMKSWSIRDTLWAYVDSKEEEEIRGFYTGFPVEIELKHAWGTWKEIVRLHATLTIGN
ncbi:E3 ubiquitin-protein ligase RNF213-like [Saccoglossus kowalevskii]